MNDHCSEARLHDHLDGELSEFERQAVLAHLDGCAQCRERMKALSAVVAGLRELPDQAEPPRDLWDGIDARIDGTDAKVVELPVRHRGPPDARGAASIRVSLTWKQLIAAGIVVALLSGALVWSILRVGPTESARSPMTAGAVTTDPAVRAASDRYEQAILELEQVIEQGEDVLSPRTLETLETSLAAIDRALAEARAALTEDPGSDLLNRLLINHQQAKLRVLQRAAAAIQL